MNTSLGLTVPSAPFLEKKVTTTERYSWYLLGEVVLIHAVLEINIATMVLTFSILGRSETWRDYEHWQVLLQSGYASLTWMICSLLIHSLPIHA
jgi:hypothetical protein